MALRGNGSLRKKVCGVAGGERPAALLGPCGCQSTQHRYCGETFRRRVLVIHLVLQFLNLVHRRLSLPRIRSMRQKWPKRKTSLCNELELGETQIQASCEFWVGVQIQTLLSRKCFVCLCVCERREAAGDPLLALQVGSQPKTRFSLATHGLPNHHARLCSQPAERQTGTTGRSRARGGGGGCW